MASTPNFVASPNNSMGVITDAGPAYIDWTSGATGGRLHQIFMRVVADQSVTVGVTLKIGGSSYRVGQMAASPIPIASQTTSSQPPTPLLTDVNFPGLANTPEGRALTFGPGDGVRLVCNTELGVGESISFFALGGDF